MVKRPVDQMQKGPAYGVGVHAQDRRSGGGCDRKRGISHSPPYDLIDIFHGGLSPPSLLR